MLQLSNIPFAEGGHRAIYFHPQDNGKCIKILLDHSTAEQKKSQAPLLKRKMRKLERFDENKEEYRVLSYIQKWAPEIVGKHIPKCYGFVETDKGEGLVTDLYRDFDDKTSLNLLSFLQTHSVKNGLKHAGLEKAIQSFQEQIYSHQILSRALLLHNIVVQRVSEHSCQLYLIDGIGNSEFIPISNYFSASRKSKIKRKIKKMNTQIGMVLRGEAL